MPPIVSRLLAVLLLTAGLGAVEVNLIASAASVTEGGSVVLIATRSSNVGTLSVPVALVGPPSFANLGGATHFVFAAGSNTATVVLNTVPNISADGARQATAQITVGGAITSTTPAVTVGVRDDDVSVSISAIDVLAGEDALPADTATLAVVLADTGSGRTDPVTVQVEVHGTALFDTDPDTNDYALSYTINGVTTPFPGDEGVELIPLIFPAGINIATLTIVPSTDSTVEGAETCELRLSTASLAYSVLGADRGTMTIADDDNRISVLSGTPAFETGLDGNIHIDFLSAFPRPIQVPYTISGVTNGTDITTMSGVATLTSGNTLDIPVDALPDDLDLKEDEVLTFALLPSADYVLPGTPSVQIEIVDRAATASIAAPAAAIVESAAPAALSFPVSIVRLPGFESYDVAVPFTVTGGSADPDAYTVGGVGVSWNAGTGSGVLVLAGTATIGSITITPVDDVVALGDKTVAIQVVNGQSVTIGGAASATGTILDDEPVVSLVRTGAATAVEDGAGVAFAVSYPGVPDGVARSQAVTVRFAITGTAAVADRTITGVSLDGNGLGGTVTIPANQRSTTILVTATKDAVAEPVEPVILTLSAPAIGAAYRLGTGTTAEVGLVDADSTPTVSISAIANAIEGRTVTCFRITRTGATTAGLTVKLGTPPASADYTALPATLLIPAGADHADLTVAAIADGADPGETIDISITDDAAYIVDPAGTTATTTIVDGFADNQIAIASEPNDLVLVTADADGWSSVCRLNLPAGLTAGRTRASLTAVTDGSAPPAWLSVAPSSPAGATGTAIFTLTGSPPVGTTAGRVLVRLLVEADIDANGTYELPIPQDLLLWVLTSGGAG